MNNNFPLQELSISQVYNGETAIYEVPIYQRNYAWGKDEIEALVQDVWDAYKKDSHSSYYIGTLVTYKKDEKTYEVIDGQQRLTTLYLILHALNKLDKTESNKLTYRARQRSTTTLNNLGKSIEEQDNGIENGYKLSKDAIEKIVTNKENNTFANYFVNNVKIIHYIVPRDVDLNHYFEVMNSRGEQLEKHEIVKAKLYAILRNDVDRVKFTQIWNACSEMSTYIQANKKLEGFFSPNLKDFKFHGKTFDDLPELNAGNINRQKLTDLIGSNIRVETKDDETGKDTFQPVIDFPNFLLIVLKITRMKKELGFRAEEFTLDDKELINEFDKAVKAASSKDEFVKEFCFNLLQAKYLLDNYVVHHANEEDKYNQNPWQLQYVWKENKDSIHTKNLCGDEENNKQLQDQLVQLLSMFEVSFTARQRKNYLFYVLCYLFDNRGLSDYCNFLDGLTEKYFKDIYMNSDCLSERNVPKPGAFDQTILKDGKVDLEIANSDITSSEFNRIYGDGSVMTKGIPLFVFNYIDYRIWKKYADEMAGEKLKERSEERQTFFSELGCSDFGLEVFNRFYFSRTRRSLEHYYPQANIGDGIDEKQINCLGNFAMIGSEANSSGSNWSPKVKLDHYLDSSQKISQVSVASLKFRIMLQICKDNTTLKPGKEWMYEDIQKHQRIMLNLLFDEC